MRTASKLIFQTSVSLALIGYLLAGCASVPTPPPMGIVGEYLPEKLDMERCITSSKAVGLGDRATLNLCLKHAA